jgi:ketosteroid isomerase-like protein
MTRSTVAHLGRAGLAVLSTIVAAGALAPAALAAPREASATWSWVDRYYADYAAMSAAPTGPAMDRWLAHYAPYAFFEDPTTAFFKDAPAGGQSGIGREAIRQPYVRAFTGSWGPVRWTIQRRVASGEWVAVEGWMNGTQQGRPIRARFTTWLKIRGGQIVHQIDYMDYAAIQRQVSGKEVVPDDGSPARTPSGGRTDADRALRVADEFYRRYDAMPALASLAGLARFVEMMTDDYRLEDPTAGLIYDSREKMHAALKESLATGDFAAIHWEIVRRITDGDWVALEGSFRGVLKGHPFATRFTTWLQVRGDRIARHVDYIDYATLRRLTAPPKEAGERQ